MKLKEGIIVCENSLRDYILAENTASFFNAKYITLDNMLSELSYKIDKEGIYYIHKKYNISPKIAKEYIDYLVYESLFYDHPKLNMLKEILEDLKKAGYAKKNLDFLNVIKNKHITILNYRGSKILLFLVSKLKNLNCDYEIIEPKEYENSIREVYEFNHISDEARFVFNSIKRKLNLGVNINNIKIAGFNDDYEFDFNRLSTFYNIPINFNSKNNIKQTDIARYLLSILDESLDFDEVLNKLNEKFKGNTYIKNIVNIINSYNLNKYKPKDTKAIIKMELEKIKYEAIIYEDAVELIDINSYSPNKNDYVFYVGFNLSLAPRVHKDINYLTDDILAKMGLDTSIEKNRMEKSILINNLNGVDNLTISYKLNTSSSAFLPSVLIEELGYKVIKDYSLFGENEKEDILSYGECLDLYRKFGIEKKSFKKSIYDINYMKYDNRFSGINTDELDSYLPETIRLSYSSIKDFYECNFKYYLGYVLGVKPKKSTEALNIGNYVHYMLEHSYDDDFSYSNCKIKATKELFGDNIKASDLFFINISDALVKGIIEFNKEHEKNTSFNVIYKEKSFDIDIIDNKLILTGKIDKLMTDDNKSFVAVVDYKTGNDVLGFKNIKAGQNLQLPIYLYILKNSNDYKSSIPVGFYLQRIKMNNDNYMLEGYTNSDIKIMSKIDPNYENSEYIKNLKISKNGEFYKYAKLLNDSDIDNAVKETHEAILKAYDDIKIGNYVINPKRNEKGKELSCGYCEFKGICYKKNRDYQTLILDEGGKEENGMD
ncbi:MAG: PD-(D/E)XK nuclease family protein [Anaeroplasmataceae bacterium]